MVTLHIPINKVFDLIKIHWSVFLILSTALLFATDTSFNIPIYIMAILGLYKLINHHDLYKMPEARFISILFFSLWIPMLLSLTDAVDLPHSLKTTLPYSRFLFAAYFIIDEVQKKNLYSKLILGLGIIITFWCFDALFQFFTGEDIFGYPMSSNLVSGLFSPKNTLGHLLAILSPIYFEIIRRNYLKHRPYSYFYYLLLLVFFSLVLLTEKRTAWLMMISSLILYSIYLLYLYKSVALKVFLIVIPVTTLILSLLITSHPPLNKKAHQTLGVFSGDYESISKATAKRLPIWETGINIYDKHRINGIGPRGFRHAYADYADVDNLFISGKRFNRTSPQHPHLIILEILAETGSIGLLGFLVFWLYLRRISIQLIRENKAHHLPWIMCIMIATLPYNAGLAFYGSYWSSITWWIILVSACFVFSGEDKNA